MDFALNLGLPILVIVVISQLLELRLFYSLVLIVALGFISSEIVDYIYCSVLETQCELDALNSVGKFIHSSIVIFFSLFISFGINGVLRKRKGQHVS